MRILMVLALGGLLAGCVTAAEQDAQHASSEDARCRSFGAKPGTDAYTSCRVQLSNQRNAVKAAVAGALLAD